MRVLLDECITRWLSRHLVGHEVRSVFEMGWLGEKNGSLLRLMTSSGFQVLLTVDKNLSY